MTQHLKATGQLYSRFRITFICTFALLGFGCSGSTATSSVNVTHSSSAPASSSSSSLNTISSASSLAASSSFTAQLSSTRASSQAPTSSSAANAEPPFAGTVYIDADIFTSADPNSYASIDYLGRGEHEVYDSRNTPSTTTQNVYRFKAQFDDDIATEIQAVPAFGSEQVAQEQATLIAQALGRIPQQLRQGVKIITLMQGEGRANASLEKNTVRIYSQGVQPELLEELLAHEAAHVALDFLYRTNSDWLHAQQADIAFISTYARDNFGSEDIAESLLPYLAIRYKPERISATNDRIINFNNAHRIAFFDKIFTGIYPMVDISPQTKAHLQTPIKNQTLAAANIAFTWQAPAGVNNFDLVVGTQNYGSNDLRASNIINNSTQVNVDVPNDGTPVFARLWTQKNNEWRYIDYRFAGFSPNIDTATMRLPAPASQLSSSTATFHWDAPTGATEFDVVIGNQGAGSNNIRASAPFTQNWLTVNNLPEDNQPIYVRLWTLKNGWNYQDIEYTASQTKAELLTPKAGSALSAGSATFTWSKPAGASNYDLIVGTNGPGSNNIRATQIINTNSLTLNNLPTGGQKIYVRLWTYKGMWRYTDYVFN